VAFRPDVIVAVADDAVRAAQAATAQIPIVMAMSSRDPVRAGLPASLDRSRIIVSGDSHRVTKILYLFSCDAIIAIW